MVKTKKELPPAQKYLRNLYVALTNGDAELVHEIIMERPQTLRNAVAAMFFHQNGDDVKRFV